MTRESLQIANVSDSEAVEVTLLTFEVGEEGASERRGDLPGLGPGACYVVPLARDVASAPELEAGTWVRVSWQNQDGSSEERWGQAGEDGTIVERQPSEGQS